MLRLGRTHPLRGLRIAGGSCLRVKTAPKLKARSYSPELRDWRRSLRWDASCVRAPTPLGKAPLRVTLWRPQEPFRSSVARYYIDYIAIIILHDYIDTCSVCCRFSGFTISAGRVCTTPLQEMLLPWGQQQPPPNLQRGRGQGFPLRTNAAAAARLLSRVYCWRCWGELTWASAPVRANHKSSRFGSRGFSVPR